VVTAATRTPTPPQQDLLHSPDFLAAVKRLGTPNCLSFDYCNIPDTAPGAYDSFPSEEKQIHDAMKSLGLDLPAIELPAIDQLRPNLSTAFSASWSDEKGTYARSVSPFPGSMLLLGDPQQMKVVVTGLSELMSVAIPAIKQERDRARQLRTMNSVQQLTIGLINYAQQHQQNYPPDLGSLLSDGEFGASDIKLFVSDQTQIPNEISTGTKQQQAAWVNEHTEYKLLMPGKPVQPAAPLTTSEIPVLIRKDYKQATGWVAVGFADGHCEVRTPDKLQEVLQNVPAADR